MSYVGGAVAWRLPIAFQIIFAIIVVVLVTGLPDSPRWLFQRGDRQGAVEVLCMVWDKDETDPWIIQEMNAIEQAIEIESEAEGSLLDCFRNDRVKTGWRVFLAWGAQFM